MIKPFTPILKDITLIPNLEIRSFFMFRYGGKITWGRFSMQIESKVSPERFMFLSKNNSCFSELKLILTTI